MRQVSLTVNASGAAEAARRGDVVLIVDVIDMSTTLEAVLDAGAYRVFGASPVDCRAPVVLNPEEIGRTAGLLAMQEKKSLVIISEPRVGYDEERKLRSAPVILGAASSGAEVEAIFPNAGAEIIKLADFRDKIIVAVTDTGGVAFDAAFTAGAAAVVTGTIARTMAKKGTAPAKAAAQRAVDAAKAAGMGITVVAASSNSLEDILAAEYIMRMIVKMGFTTEFFTHKLP